MTFQAASPTSSRQAIIFPGFVGWWKFVEGSGTTVSDSSGFGNAVLPANRAQVIVLGNNTDSLRWLVNSVNGTQFGVW